MVFARPIVTWFRNDPEVIAVGTVALRWQASVLPLQATIVLTNMMLQSMGRGAAASLTSSARNGVFFIPLILTLPRLFGLPGVEMTQAWADILSFFLCILVARAELHRIKKEEALAEGRSG